MHRPSSTLIGLLFASLASSARADLSDGSALFLLSLLVLGPLALLYVISRVARSLVPNRHKTFASTLAVALPANVYLLHLLRVFEPPVSQGKVAFVFTSIAALLAYVIWHFKRSRDR